MSSHTQHGHTHVLCVGCMLILRGWGGGMEGESSRCQEPGRGQWGSPSAVHSDSCACEWGWCRLAHPWLGMSVPLPSLTCFSSCSYSPHTPPGLSGSHLTSLVTEGAQCQMVWGKGQGEQQDSPEGSWRQALCQHAHVRIWRGVILSRGEHGRLRKPVPRVCAA